MSRYERSVTAGLAALFVVRAALAGFVPLSSDEALYWRYSQYLSPGYVDHPPMTMLMIRAGVELFGDTEFGVRAFGLLSGLLATVAVWAAGLALFDRRTAATAALLFNLTLMVALGATLMTPDNPVMLAAAALLFCLAKLTQTDRGEWWIAAGAAVGLGMASKYTMFWPAIGIVIWLVGVPQMRRWLWSPWTWAGGILSVALFSPVLWWNAQHEWASILNQGDRLSPTTFGQFYVGDYIASQFAAATPGIFILAVMGLMGLIRQRPGTEAGRALLHLMIWPTLLYFLWHSLHGRVEANWPAAAYPALAIVAAAAVERMPWSGFRQTLVQWSWRSAVPVGLGLAALIYAQALFAIVPLGPSDPTVSRLATGWRELGVQIDEIRKQTGADAILAVEYGLVSWLSFYVPSRPPVHQVIQRLRWIGEPQPDPKQFEDKPTLFICTAECGWQAFPLSRFNSVELVTRLPRVWRGRVVRTYDIYKVGRPHDPVLNPVEPMRRDF